MCAGSIITKTPAKPTQGASSSYSSLAGTAPGDTGRARDQRHSDATAGSSTAAQPSSSLHAVVELERMRRSLDAGAASVLRPQGSGGQPEGRSSAWPESSGVVVGGGASTSTLAAGLNLSSLQQNMRELQAAVASTQGGPRALVAGAAAEVGRLGVNLASSASKAGAGGWDSSHAGGGAGGSTLGGGKQSFLDRLTAAAEPNQGPQVRQPGQQQPGVQNPLGASVQSSLEPAAAALAMVQVGTFVGLAKSVDTYLCDTSVKCCI